jgi:hypothetical protein
MYYDKENRRRYIGARYVPRIEGLWDINKEYENFSIVVTPENNSYTSKKSVPIGIPLTDTEYWVQTGNFEAVFGQLEDKVNQHITDSAQEFTDVNKKIDTHIINADQNFIEVNKRITDNRLELDSIINSLDSKNDSEHFEIIEDINTNTQDINSLSTVVNANKTAQNTVNTELQNKDIEQDNKIKANTDKNTEQDLKITALEDRFVPLDDRISDLEQIAPNYVWEKISLTPTTLFASNNKLISDGVYSGTITFMSLDKTSFYHAQLVFACANNKLVQTIKINENSYGTLPRVTIATISGNDMGYYAFQVNTETPVAGKVVGEFRNIMNYMGM